MDKKIKEQDEKIINITKLSTEKEIKLSAEIAQYQKQIEKLKEEVELSNKTISNLTEEKEHNISEIGKLKNETESLKNQNISINEEKSKQEKKIEELLAQLNEKEKNMNDLKKNEDLLKNYKKMITTFSKEKKELEEVVMKQEEKVSELSSQLGNVSETLKEKEKELQDNIEYTAKLTSMLNNNKKEISKLKASNSIKDKNKEEISSLQNEIKNLKKEIEAKNSKINLLSMNNKIISGKLQKQLQMIPSLNPSMKTNDKRPIKIINNNITNDKTTNNKNNDDLPLSAKEARNKVSLGKIKPHSQQQNKKSSNSINPANINKKIASSVKRSNKYNTGSILFPKDENNKIKDEDNTYHSHNPSTKGEKFFIVAKSKINTPSKINNNFDLDEEKIGKFEEKEKEISFIKPDSHRPPHIDTALELEFPIIESFCVLNGTMKTEENNNDNNDEDDDDDNEVAKLHNCVDKILNEF